uniref:Ig-like domain-containing protein n=1 Tax=Sparus aurata TaxID=8175 RepID=A0A671TED3_SPAAU
MITPSAVVTEGQRVTLTCSTSCPLNTNYTWTFNSRPLNLPENQNKQLVLDPVGSQHAGNYSCAVKTHISSRESTLTVRGGTLTVLREYGFKIAVTFLNNWNGLNLIRTVINLYNMTKIQEEENWDSRC